MTICRIVFLAWLMLGLGCYLAKHGEPKTGKYDFWTALISTILQVLLLWGGGFFN